MNFETQAGSRRSTPDDISNGHGRDPKRVVPGVRGTHEAPSARADRRQEDRDALRVRVRVQLSHVGKSKERSSGVTMDDKSKDHDEKLRDLRQRMEDLKAIRRGERERQSPRAAAKASDRKRGSTQHR